MSASEMAAHIARRTSDCAFVGVADGKAIYRIRGEYVFDDIGADLCRSLGALFGAAGTGPASQPTPPASSPPIGNGPVAPANVSNRTGK